MVFTGENYNEWSTELVNALRAKRKLGVIDGTIPKPPVNELNFELWSSVNSMIFGWIRTSIESRVRSTVTFISDSHKLWENLKKRFSVGNKVRVHHLKEQIASCKQNSQSMMDYFGWLAKMWEELDMYKPLPACSCNAAAEYEKEREEENAHQFLMGLDESRFGIVCQRWCARNNVSSLLRIVKLRVMLLALLQRRNHWSQQIPDKIDEEFLNVHIVVVVVIRKLTVGSWLGSQIGGTKHHQIAVTTKEVVVVGHLHQTATETMEFELTMLMQHPPTHPPFQLSPRNNCERLPR